MAKNCFICKASFDKTPQLLDHLEEKHGDQIPDDMSIKKYYYAQTHGGITEGKCQICKAPTEFDEKTGRPFVLCRKPSCKEISRKRFRENMARVHGKEHLCNDMEHQKKMQEGRSIHGKYKFTDGGEIGYLSMLEHDFLRYCDKVLELSSQEIEETGVVLKYQDEKNVERKYMLDYYLNMYNLIIEIKEGGVNPNTHPNYIANTKNKEVYKDMALLEQKTYNVVKIYNNDFRPLIKILFNIKNDIIKNKKPTKQFIEIEDKVANSFYSESSGAIENRNLYLVEFRDKFTKSLITFGITDTISLHYMYIPIEGEGFVPTSPIIKPLKSSCIIINKFTGPKDNLNDILTVFNGDTIKFPLESTTYHEALLEILADSNINVAIDHMLFNNLNGVNDFSKVITIDEFRSMNQIKEAVFQVPSV